MTELERLTLVAAKAIAGRSWDEIMLENTEQRTITREAWMNREYGHYLPEAELAVRAILLAIREPTEDMIRAATPILNNGLASRAVKEFNAAGSVHVWQAMIDHLLAEAT